MMSAIERRCEILGHVSTQVAPPVTEVESEAEREVFVVTASASILAKGMKQMNVYQATKESEGSTH